MVTETNCAEIDGVPLPSQTLEPLYFGENRNAISDAAFCIRGAAATNTINILRGQTASMATGIYRINKT